MNLLEYKKINELSRFNCPGGTDAYVDLEDSITFLCTFSALKAESLKTRKFLVTFCKKTYRNKISIWMMTSTSEMKILNTGIYFSGSNNIEDYGQTVERFLFFDGEELLFRPINEDF